MPHVPPPDGLSEVGSGDLLSDLDRPFVLLEDRLDLTACARLYSEPRDTVRCDSPEDLGAAFRRIQRGLDRGLHAAGFLAYELGYALEPRLVSLMPERRGGPLLWMGLFPPPRQIDAATLDTAFADLGAPRPIQDVTCDHDRAAHIAKVQAILGLIAAGDLYQANLTFPIRFRHGGDPLALYAALRCRQPVGHGALVALEDATILSASPELFVRISDGHATCRPMKGTAARQADPQADRAAAEVLRQDPKQRAENLMIVDLLRNDLARICDAGTVRAPTLFSVETYPTFHALTSTVTGRVRPNLSLAEQLGALFPCGSIVGAPKIRAAEVIRALEPEPRGAYTGAIGAASPDGGLDLNVAIRTATLTMGGTGVYGVGGGVVADSDPAGEYDEALLKARVLYSLAEDFELIETFRWSATLGYVRLKQHLDRLHASARSLGFAIDVLRLRAALAALAAELPTAQGSDQRVKVSLARDGAAALVHQPAPPSEPLRICLAEDRLDAGDPYLRHKTSRREVFDRAFAQATAAGCGDAVLLNRAGALADGSRTSLFVETEGRLLTPPIAAGALPGILRGQLISEGRALEHPLSLTDLERSKVVYVGNSLHGLRRARFRR